MNINDIKNSLEELGYYCTFRNNELNVGQDYKFDKTLGFGTYQKGFSVYLKNNNVSIEYPLGQLSIEKEFKTSEELLKFVRQVFPIED